MQVWEKPEIQALGEERIHLLQEAVEKSRDKTGLARLDVFLEYSEKLAEGGALSAQQKEALILAMEESLSPQEKQQWQQAQQLMHMFSQTA